jgi:hypothetical protein
MIDSIKTSRADSFLEYQFPVAGQSQAVQFPTMPDENFGLSSQELLGRDLAQSGGDLVWLSRDRLDVGVRNSGIGLIHEWDSGICSLNHLRDGQQRLQ